MSVFMDMVPVLLQVNKPVKGASGAQIENYVSVTTIDVAIYQNDAFKGAQSVAYEQSTHSGCTFYKGFEKGKEYKITVGMHDYFVTYFNMQGRFTNLLLKQVILK